MRRTSFFLHFIALLLAISLIPLPAGAEGPELVTVQVGVNLEPVAENLDVETYQNTAVTGTLRASDPDGGDVAYTLIARPRKGSVALREDGSFTYTPAEKRRGRDTFSYTARDLRGGISNVAVVTVTILRQKTEVTYADTAGTGAEYAALYLAEHGIYTGERLGDTWLFHPQRTVLRGEFLAMAMAMVRPEPPEATTAAGFSDDGEIPDWLKPAAASAVLLGLDGVGSAALEASLPLTGEAAAVLLDGVASLSDVTALPEEPVCAPWAEQAWADASACHLLDGLEAGQQLTMGDAAMLLARAGAVLARRG